MAQLLVLVALPLVEICGASQTSPDTIARAAAVLSRGRHAPARRPPRGRRLHRRRLLEALWREALWLVADDVATAEEIDDAIRFGAGLRWAAMGTFLTYRLAGGEAGMRHFMARSGRRCSCRGRTSPTSRSSARSCWTSSSPSQTRRPAGARSPSSSRCATTAWWRCSPDRATRGFGAGATVAETERRWRERAPAPAAPHDGLLRLHEAIVAPEWIDYNGHMTEYRYLQVLADTTDAFLERIGIDAASAAQGRSYYTVESHLRHLGQAHAGDRLATSTRLLGHDDKRLHLFHELFAAHRNAPVATGEHILLHVDRTAGKTTPAAAERSPTPRPSWRGRRRRALRFSGPALARRDGRCGRSPRTRWPPERPSSIRPRSTRRSATPSEADSLHIFVQSSSAA